MRKIGAIVAMVILLAPLALPRVFAQQEINVFYQLTPEEDVKFRKILQQAGKDLNIKVKPINMDTIDTMNKVSAEVRAGRGSVNIIFTDVTYVGMWYKSGTYLDLTSRFNDWKDKPDIFKLVLDVGIIEDKIVALPLRTDCEVLYYNEEMFNKYKVPTPDTWKSWDDFYNAAKTFKEKPELQSLE
jgi:ABC-type sugar transport system, periplasmic component